MRLAVRFVDRVGVTQEALALLAQRQLNLAAVEMAPPYVYIDAPALSQQVLHDLRDLLFQIDGVQDVSVVDMLPGQRRRLHLDALMASMADPVLAIDAKAVIVVANSAAALVAGKSEAELTGMALGQLFGDQALQAELVEAGFRAPPREVTLRGEPFQLDVTPVSEGGLPGGAAAGGVVTLHAPSRLGERLHALQHFDEGGFEKIRGDSPAIRALKARAARVAAVDAPLLILGETGTGKELVAQACHHASQRQTAPFLALNCAALPESLAESELFGYAPGAFSGAQRGGKPGLLELANHGTVFLDEVGEMSPYLQVKLLRFLNDGRFRRVGGEREVKVDVRIISATHRDLAKLVEEREFREDLYYRLNVLTVQVPPLRDRPDDILALARFFIQRACAQVQRSPCRLSAAAGAALRANNWPGNVRQLQNVIFRAVTLTDKDRLDTSDLDLAGSHVERAGALENDVTDLGQAVAAYEKRLLEHLYRLYPSSRKLAAHLGSSHTTIAYKLRKHRIARPDSAGCTEN